MSLFNNQFGNGPMSGMGYGYIGYMDQQMAQVQNSFDGIRKKMQADAKAEALKAENEATAGSGTGVFSPAQGYDHSAAGTWAQENQDYVSQQNFNIML
jgi:hypothetical protein